MKNKKNQAAFKLVKITNEQFAVFKENCEQGNFEYDIDFKTNVRVSIGQHMVGIFTKYVFSQKKGIVLVIECGCHFNLFDHYWNVNVTDNILIIDKKLLTHLLVLTVGTSRGVLHSKKPTWLSSIMLPTLNVISVISDDMNFDLSNLEEEE